MRYVKIIESDEWTSIFAIADDGLETCIYDTTGEYIEFWGKGMYPKDNHEVPALDMVRDDLSPNVTEITEEEAFLEMI